MTNPPPNTDLVERVAAAMRPTLFRMYLNGQSASHRRARQDARAAIAITQAETDKRIAETTLAYQQAEANLAAAAHRINARDKRIADLEAIIEFAMRELADRDEFYQQRVQKALLALARAALKRGAVIMGNELIERLNDVGVLLMRARESGVFNDDTEAAEKVVDALISIARGAEHSQSPTNKGKDER